jgi:23S rRNA pseudouridine1911/1915/1917 synthase
MRRLTLDAGPGDDGERIDRFIAARGGISRGEARRVLERGGVFLDGKRCKVTGRILHDGQKVTVNLEEAGHGADAPAPLERSRLLFADEQVAVVDKPAGVAAQPTLTTDRGHLPELVSALTGTAAILVHRLDRETSGVTILARTADAARKLTDAFRDGTPEKTYLALCARAPEPAEGRVDAPIGKDPRHPARRAVMEGGQAAATGYRTLAVGPGGAALVEARPETGRTHQIRVHLAHLGAPLLGDARYGGPRMVGDVAIPRVMLHALRLTVGHPVTGARMTFEAPVPGDFEAARKALVDPA